MAKKTALKGRYLMLFVAGNYLPLATSCSMNESFSMIDPESKDDGVHKVPDPDSKEWTIDFECQLDDGCTTLSTLHTLHANQTKTALIFGKATNAADTEIPTDGWTAPTAAGNALQGNGYLSSLKVDGPLNGKCTISGTFSGADDLVAMT